MWGEEGFELARGVQGGRGQQAGVDAHSHLMHNPCWVRDAVGRLEDGAGGPGGGEEVGHGGSWDQRTRRGV